MSLNYPNGFKYYVDKKEIKDAYDKKQMQKQFDALQKELKERHSESPIGSNNAPSFAMKKQKDEGFGSILK